jgi:hypothetical protein
MSDTPETDRDLPTSASPAKDSTYGWGEAPDTSSEPLPSLPKPPKSGFIWFLQGAAVIGILILMAAFSTPAVRQSRPASKRSQCKNNLKQIGLALHNYYETFNMLPPAYTIDENGKRRHSWRTLILPYLDQAALYNAINFHKPWDDPANLKLFEQSNVSVFQCPSATMPKNYTTYLAIVGKDCCFQSSGTRKHADVKDGLSNTLAVIEATPEQAVPWMSPLDAYQELVLAIDPRHKHSHVGGMHVLVMDGAVRHLSLEIPTDTLRALTTIAGNDTPGDW